MLQQKAADLPDRPQARLLDALPHTEVLESVYNRASKPASVAPLDDVVYFAAPLSGQSEEGDRYGYAAGPRFADLHVSTVQQILSALERSGLPTVLPYAPEDLAAAALADKKREGDRLPLIVIRGIGDCGIETIPGGEFEAWLRDGGAV